MLTRHTEPGFQTVCGVIDAGMDYLAVARAGFRTDRVRPFKDDDFAASHGKAARHGQTDNAGSHHNTIDAVDHSRFPFPSPFALGRISCRNPLLADEQDRANAIFHSTAATKINII